MDAVLTIAGDEVGAVVADLDLVGCDQLNAMQLVSHGDRTADVGADAVVVDSDA